MTTPLHPNPRTSGLVLTLSADVELAAAAASRIRLRHEFMVGAPSGRWLPVAVEGRDEGEMRDLHDWVQAIPGVEYVDVAYVNFGDADLFDPATIEVKHEH